MFLQNPGWQQLLHFYNLYQTEVWQLCHSFFTSSSQILFTLKNLVFHPTPEANLPL